jgi:hypothetical protein
MQQTFENKFLLYNFFCATENSFPVAKNHLNCRYAPGRNGEDKRTLDHHSIRNAFGMQTFNSIDQSQHSITRLRQTTTELLKLIKKFDNKRFNEVAFTGSWTAARVADHIRKSVKGIPSVLNGGSSQPERIPDEKFELIRKVFLDFEARYQAPEFIIPADAQHTVEEMHTRLSEVFNSLISTAESIDLSLVYPDFEVPRMGKFTGFEWIEFVHCHTSRHIHQLRNIQEALYESTN